MPMMKETMLKRLLLPIAAAGGGGSAPVQDTATGNPLVFFTDLARPLKSLLIPFTPQQEGTGDPSPQNVRSILPWNGLTVFGGNSNLLTNTNQKPSLYSVSDDGTITTNASSQGYAWSYSNAVYVTYLPAGKYTVIEEIVTAPTWTGDGFQLKNEDNGWLAERGYATFTLSKGMKVGLVCKPQNGAFRYSIVKGTAGEYEKQETTETDIVFPSPVYGGEHEAVSGKLMDGYIMREFLWSEGQNQSDRGSVTRKRFPLNANVDDINPYDVCNVAKFKADYYSDDIHFYVNGTNNEAFVFLPNDTPDNTEIVIVAKLATPQEQTLTGNQLTALVGNNTIWSDANGQMTATYLKKAQ